MIRLSSFARVTLVAAGLAVVALPLPASAQLFGGGNNNPPPQGDDIDQRLDRLENSLRQLTGTIEQLQYRNQQLEQQVKSLQGGGAASGPPAQAPIAVAPAPGRMAPSSAPQVAPAPGGGRRSDVFDPDANPNAPGAPRVLGSSASASSEIPVGAPGGREAGAPLDLNSGGQQGGQLPGPPQRNASATGAVVAAPQPASGPSQQLGQAYGQLQGKDYASAESTLRDFVKRYPKDNLADEANFWLGETLFQRQRYRDAAEVFLGVTKNFDKSAKAPDALLRLGQSLAAMNEREAACAALGEVNRKYQKASADIKKNVDAEQKKNRC